MKHRLLVMCALWVTFVSHAGAAEDPAASDRARERFLPWTPSPGKSMRAAVLEGRVLTPENLPARGAVVVSSAGGKAVSDAAGFFALEAELPRDAQRVQVTAVQTGATGSRVASAAVHLSQTKGSIPVGTLRLEQGASCEPSWLPTFGGEPGLEYPHAALAAYDDGSGSGPVLYVGGSFTSAGGLPLRYIAKWDGTTWSAVGSGVDAAVFALTVHDDGLGGGPALYAAGSFTSAGGVAASRIAKWDGTSWSGLGNGLTNHWITALSTYDDGAGGGPALYAGGYFTSIEGVPANRIARWDGATWSTLGSGIGDGFGPPTVHALAVHDDGAGSGLSLYVGGRFTHAGGVLVNGIARWNGTFWRPVGGGMTLGPPPPVVEALTVYDDGAGGGPALYAGGWFMLAGGVRVDQIARWDGSAWSALGSGVNAGISALTVYDDGAGGGAALYAGGEFTLAGGVPTSHVARWNGLVWSPLGSGIAGDVRSLAVYDEGTGSGPALYVGGDFVTAGGQAARYIATWNGSAWSPLASGVDEQVLVLTVHDDGSGGGPALYAGGSFVASPAGDSHIAKWGGCAPSQIGVPYCFGDGSGTPCPCNNAGGTGEGCGNSSGMGAMLAAGGSASVAADDLTFVATNLLPNQPALLFVGHDAIDNGNGIVFGDGLRCAGGNVRRLGVSVPNASGAADWGPGLARQGMFDPGSTRRFQVWYRDPSSSPCGFKFNSSHGVELLLAP